MTIEDAYRLRDHIKMQMEALNLALKNLDGEIKTFLINSTKEQVEEKKQE